MRVVLCRLSILGIVLVIAGAGTDAHAQSGTGLLRDRTPADQPMLLVVGSLHFANPGRDLVNVEVDDVLSAKRQKEIAAVVEELAAFRPTHIAIEWDARAQERLDAHYDGYRRGSEALSRREADQLGVRLAAKLGLKKIYAVDWNDGPPGDASHYDWPGYGQEHGQKDRVGALLDPARTIGIMPLGQQSIGAWLIALNTPEAILANHRNYFDIASIGDASLQPGANWVGHWYGRNLRIFNNIVRLSDDPASRILVLYGQGHAYLLRQFAKESGAFRVVDVATVMKGRPSAR